jgi:hypothetical protein
MRDTTRREETTGNDLPDADPMPFDGTRPVYGGFEMIVAARGPDRRIGSRP